MATTENGIYYPSNYQASADVPEDMKDMANSIDVLIGQLKLDSGATIELSMNASTYVLTANLKNKAGTLVSTTNVDLPLESMIVNCSYDSTNKKLILTLQSGQTIEIPLADLISGLQAEITTQNKLSSDLVDDTNKTHKFVTASEKTSWNAKYNKPNTGIPKTDLANNVQTSLDKADTAIQEHQDISGKEDKSNKTTELTSESTDTQYPSAKAVYESQAEQDTEIEQLQTKVTNLEETANSELEDGTAEGTEITVNDSATADGSIVPNGNTSQVQTNGYQLMNQVSANQSTEMNGLHLEAYKNGIYKIYGTATASVQALISVANGEWKSANSTYYTSLSAGTYNYKATIIEGTFNKLRARSGSTNLTNPSSDVGEFTLESDIDDFNIYMYINSGTTLNCTFKIMLEKGTIAHDWEEYSGGQASPNPTYTQPVHVLKGSNTIKINNKNLIDLQNKNQTTSYGITYTVKDNEIVLNGTADRNGRINVANLKNNINFSTGENYAFSLVSEGTSTRNFDVQLRNSTSQTTIWGVITTSFPSIKNDITGVADTLALYVYSGMTFNNVKIKLQVEKNTIVTDYESHKEQVKTLTLPNGLEMCGIEDSRDEFVKDLSTGKWYKDEKINKAILIDTENWADRPNFNACDRFVLSTNIIPIQTQKCYSNYFITVNSDVSNTDIGKIILNNGTQIIVNFSEKGTTTLGQFKDWLSSHNVELYYVRANSQLIEITDTTLIAELDDLYETLRTYYGQTNITVEAEDLAPYMTLNYKKTNRNLNSEIELIKARLDLLEG